MGAIALNRFESLIAKVSPTWGLDRMRSKAKLAIVQDRLRAYNGASFGPMTRDWIVNRNSAQTELYYAQPTLRDRMRDLVRNDAFAKRAIHALTNNIIGTGIIPTINSTATGAQQKTEKSFLEWCSSFDSDYYGYSTFYGNQRLSTMAMTTDGGVLIVKRYKGMGRKMQLSLQILEIDYLVEWRTFVNDDMSYVRKGIHYDYQGKVLGYDIYEQHPGDNLIMTGLKYNFVPAKDVIHLFRTDRPGQGVGEPWGAAAMLDLKMLNDYLILQAHKQRLSASLTGVIQTTAAADFGDSGSASARPNDQYGGIASEGFVPGIWQVLFPGETMGFMPTPKVDELDIYVKTYLKKIASGFNLTYEVMSGDMADTNFASGRMGWIEMHRFIESMQEHLLIPRLCERVWAWWYELEVLKGTAAAGSYGLGCSWTAPRREMIDPVKETKAMIEQIQAGLLAGSDAVRTMGNDPVKHIAEMVRWKNMLNDAGLVVSSDYTVIHEENMKSNKPDGETEGDKEPTEKKDKPKPE
jgi:lambda family phage portal protein